MTSRDLFARAMELFDELCDLPPAEQESALDARCAGDGELRDRVRSMLRQDASTGAPIGAGGGGVAALASSLADGDPVALPERVGRYRVVREIGRGGMGVVYEAEQENPKRRVALKVMRRGITTRQTLRRFQHEAHVLGQLDHRGIAQIYEADTEAIDGAATPYFVMEYIEGRPLDAHVRDSGLSSAETLELMARVCDAVHHAHQKGVIHRDLKPGNVLVKDETTATTGHGSTMVDTIGQPKVLDFGIARVTDADVQATTMRTDVGQIVGTVAYMSPEQLAGDSRLLDTRCDVYALGVMLYRLLAGRPPHDLSGKPIAEAARIVREEDPPRLGSISPALRGDAETIVGKAMEKDADRRYGSAAQLADDIRRHLRREPVLAHPPSRAYLLRRFAQRNRGLVAGVAAAFALLVLGVIGTSLGLASSLRANDSLERTNAELERTNRDLDAVSDFQAAQLSAIDPLLMGARMRASLLDAAPETERDGLAAGLRAVNFTDQARESLEVNIFDRSIAAVDERFADQPLLRARLLLTLAETLRELGMYNAGLDPARRAVEIYSAELGERTLGTADARRAYGALLFHTNAYDAAEREFEAAVSVFREIEGQHSDGALKALDGLAITRLNNGGADEAIRLLGDVVSARRAALGAAHASTILSIGNLANAVSNTGAYEEAEPLYREAYRSATDAFGPDDERTMRAAADLADFLKIDARYDEALELFERVLAWNRSSLGDRHPETLAAINNYAGLLDRLGRYDEAEALYRECFEGQTEVYGPDAQRTLMSAGNLGFVLNLQGKRAEAEPYYRAAYEGLERTLGPDHPSTLNYAGNLGALLLQLDRPVEAERLHLIAYEGRSAVLGPDHPSTLNAVHNMGNMLRTVGKLDEAEPYCVRALEGYEGLGPDHVGTQHSLVLMARLRDAQGRPDEAEAFFERAVESRARTLGEDHPVTVSTADELAALRERRGQ